MKIVKVAPLIGIASIALALGIANPLGLTGSQSVVLSGLLATVLFWATGAVHKTIGSIFFIIVAVVFSGADPLAIIGFAWSPVNLLIMTTTLLSVAIMKSAVVKKTIEKLLQKASSNRLLFLAFPYLLGIVLVFLIPQAFARVIILGTILDGIIKSDAGMEESAKKVVIFNAFIATSMSYMFFQNGDIVLNASAIKFAEEGAPGVIETLSYFKWFEMMSVPTLVTCIVTLGLTYLLFRKELNSFSGAMISAEEGGTATVKNPDSAEKNTKTPMNEKLSILVMLGVIVFWIVSPFVKVVAVEPWIAAAVGTALMYALRVLDRKDLKSVNVHLVLFFMAAFNIGKTLGASGISSVLFERLKQILPGTQGTPYLFAAAVLFMILHIVIGSSVATMSVVLPIIIPITTEFGYHPAVITLMIYVCSNIHFLLPFNHAVMMIGIGKKYYPDTYMLKFGICMSLIVLPLLYFVYFRWWELLGMM